MRQSLGVVVLAVGVLAGSAPPAGAQVSVTVRSPYINVDVRKDGAGRKQVRLHVPGWFNVQLPWRSPYALPPAAEPAPEEIAPPRARPPDAAPPVVPAVPGEAVRPLTLREFAAVFQPAPGNHEVLLVHPLTQAPVPVRFTLPPGAPKVRVHRRELEFDYGKREVEVRFLRGGRVKVEYD
jgi:hypothetical protein